MTHFKHYFSKNYLPKWIVFIFDITILLCSWLAAFILRFSFNMSSIEAIFKPFNLVLIIPVFVLCFWKLKCYSGILRHSTIRDIKDIVSSVMSAGIILAFFSWIGRVWGISVFIMPYSVIAIFVPLVAIILIISRLIARIIFQKLIKNKASTQNIMIFGAGRLGQATLNALLLGTTMNYRVVGFIDDNETLHNKYVSGVPIYSEKKAFSKIIAENKVKEIIFAVEHSKITNKRRRKITELCIDNQLIVKEVPPIKTWINGELHAKAIRPINIEDLLGRDSIQLDRNKIEEGLKNLVVLVTGAAGSIGSEIVRQLIQFNVKKVILLDKAESDLYNLQQELITKKDKTSFEIIVGDVTNKNKMRRLFKEFSPNFVFNAAAYKHVPLMEEFPNEAICVNIGGNKVLADLSIEFGVEKYVYISTDKAVNPTSVMGASKRISEIYIQSLAQSGRFATKFITTRFGNVLGSNGSVVPLFKKQIANGGPVTITHKDITRYFMTIPEACQLVLEAGFMGKGGEIFVFDMGEPVKIYDLAKKMISLSGFVPQRDIKIKVIGLRPGEKLYEELLDNKEVLLTHTYNDKIMIGKTRKHDMDIVNRNILDLLSGVDIMTNTHLVQRMMRIVPEFVSMNSYYSNLIEVEAEPELVGQLIYFKQKAIEMSQSYNKVKHLKKGKMIATN